MNYSVLKIYILSIILCFTGILVSQTDTTAYKPKEFYFDENTGEVKGAYFLKLEKLIDRRTDSLEDLKLKRASKEVLRKVNIGRPKNQRFYDIYPSPDFKSYFKIKENYGEIYKVYFFSPEGQLLKSHKIDPPVDGGICYNSANTYLMIYGHVQPDYYFFTKNGTLVRKGDFNQFTGDSGTSYWQPNIGKTGKVWLLVNNDTYIYDKNSNLLDKFSGGGTTYLDEDKNLVLYVTRTRIVVYNYISKRIEYETVIKDNRRLHIEADKLFIKFTKNGNHYRYKIKF